MKLHCFNHGLNILSTSSHKKEGAVIQELLAKEGQEDVASAPASGLAEATNIQLGQTEKEEERGRGVWVWGVGKVCGWGRGAEVGCVGGRLVCVGA